MAIGPLDFEIPERGILHGTAPFPSASQQSYRPHACECDMSELRPLQSLMWSSFFGTNNCVAIEHAT